MTGGRDGITEWMDWCPTSTLWSKTSMTNCFQLIICSFRELIDIFKFLTIMVKRLNIKMTRGLNLIKRQYSTGIPCS